LQEEKLSAITKPSWRDVVDFRNVVIHGYFGLSLDEVYMIIKKELPVLEKEIILFFKKLWKEESMQKPFEDTLAELRFMERDESVTRLMQIKKSILKKPKSKGIKSKSIKKGTKK
jgi:hypothetical protein